MRMQWIRSFVYFTDRQTDDTHVAHRNNNTITNTYLVYECNKFYGQENVVVIK